MWWGAICSGFHLERIMVCCIMIAAAGGRGESWTQCLRKRQKLMKRIVLSYVRVVARRTTNAPKLLLTSRLWSKTKSAQIIFRVITIYQPGSVDHAGAIFLPQRKESLFQLSSEIDGRPSVTPPSNGRPVQRRVSAVYARNLGLLARNWRVKNLLTFQDRYPKNRKWRRSRLIYRHR